MSDDAFKRNNKSFTHPSVDRLFFLLATLSAYVLWPRSVDVINVSRSDTLHESGYGYIIKDLHPPSMLWRYKSDGSNTPNSSDLQLFEDGVPLGPAHSLHDKIREDGSGRYSFWRNHLYFSTSDNSGPFENGRNYLIKATRFTQPVVVYALLLLTLLSFVKARGIARALRLVGALVFALASILTIGLVSVNSAVIPLQASLNFSAGDLEEAPTRYADAHHDTYWLQVMGFLKPFVRINYTPDTVDHLCKAGAFSIDGKPLVFHSESFTSHSREPSTQSPGWFKCSPPYVIFGVAPNTPIASDTLISFRVPFLVTDSAFVVLAVASCMGVLAWLAGRSVRPLLHGTLWLGVFSITAALFLLTLNALGATQSLRASGIDPDEWQAGMNRGPSDVKLTYADAQKMIEAASGEQSRVLAEAYLSIVTDAMGHSWRPELVDAQNIRIPLWENYLLWFLGGVSERFHMYVFANPDKALQRGVGLCSDMAFVLAKLLTAKGIEAKLVGLDGHVVVTAQVDEEEWHVLDPDYGVYLPYSIPELEVGPDIVRKYYSPRLRATLGPNTGKAVTADIIRFYGAEGNELTPIDSYQRLERDEDERLLYLLKWALPMGVAVFGILLLLTSAKLNKQSPQVRR